MHTLKIPVMSAAFIHYANIPNTVAQVSVITRIIISLPSRRGNYLVRTLHGRILDEIYAKCQCKHFLYHKFLIKALLIKNILLHCKSLIFIQLLRLVYELFLLSSVALLTWQISVTTSLIIIVHSEVSKRNELFIAVDLYDSRNLYISYLLILLSVLLEVISLNSRVIALFFLLTVSILDYVYFILYFYPSYNVFRKNKLRYDTLLLFLYCN